MAQQSLSERLAGWMRGRYGADELGNTVVGVSVALLVIDLFAHTRWLSALALAAALYSCWRLSSKNIAGRRAENQAFLNLLGPVGAWAKNPAAAIGERRSYKHLTCPSCKQKMRVPRGKGKMRVTCPSCHKKFETKS